MGDRDVPSVPITTLAGLTSLSDMLSELPISTPLDGANNLLATRDDSLIGQLVNAIEQTNSDHIELKDQYSQQQAQQQANQSRQQLLQEGPLLLQAIHACRADVFNRPSSSTGQQQSQQKI
ncbi:hypothetical protein pipiens_010585, partial [Culex pipiens pipiens]